MADIHGSPAEATQNPQATGSGPAPVPYTGARPGEPPGYGVTLDIGDSAAGVLSGFAPMPTLHESPAAHDIAAGLADAPYAPGQPGPIFVGGDPDPGGRDVVSGTVAGAVQARLAQLAELEGDIKPQGATYGDLMTFPPGPLDPGAGVGNTAPLGGFYDPPREYT